MNPSLQLPRTRRMHARATQQLHRAAFVTFLTASDAYLPGALMVAYALKQQQLRADLVCLVTEDVSAAARCALEVLYDRVIKVRRIQVRCKQARGHPAIPQMFTRLNALRLGPDGDLGCAYDKVIVLDSDVLPLKNYRELLKVSAPAGILNESKAHLLTVDSENKYLLPADLEETGKWCWHRHYDAICPHGSPVPKVITDRVATDPSNMGMSGALFIFEPSFTELRAILTDLARPEVRQLVGEKFTWPDMQYLTLRYSGHWHNIDLRYCALNGYPSLSVLWGDHFAGVKPWATSNRSIRHYSRFEDFQLWQRQYLKMLEHYPVLARYGRLKRLGEKIRMLRA